MAAHQFHVAGMTSRRCVRAISGCVSDVPGVRTVEAQLDAGTLRVTGTAPVTAVVAAIRRAGYDVIAPADGTALADTGDQRRTGMAAGTTRRAVGGGAEQPLTREENHDEAGRTDNRERAIGGGTMTDKIVAFVLYPGLTPLDLIGPLQVMTGLEVVEGVYGIQPRHHVVVVAEHLDAVPTDTPVRVAATSTLDEFPEPDIVVVPGGGAPTLRQLVNPVLLDYLRKADGSAEVVASVCTGALLLAAAGPLQGHRATTHWAYHRFLNRLGATYVPQRWVQDGRYLTGAGVSAGIDTALQLAATLTNDDVARMVQLAIEYDPHPPHGGIDWTTVDRDSFAGRVEGFAHQALGEHPAMLARVLGSAEGAG